MAQDQPTGVWLREGDLVYMLEGTGQFRKGVEILQNRYTVRVGTAPGRPQAEAEILAEQLMQGMNAKSGPLTGADLLAQAQAAGPGNKTNVTSP